MVCPCRLARRPYHDQIRAWYKARLAYVVTHPQKNVTLNNYISKRAKYGGTVHPLLLIFSKYFYTSCITSYFTFFLIR